MRILLLLFASGCIAGTVKAHTGVVADDRGRGVQAGVALGFGISGKRSAVVESAGFVGGQAPKAGLGVHIDYVSFPEYGDDDRNIGFRVGIGGTALAYGKPLTAGARVASLFVVRDKRHHTSGHEKMGGGSTTRNIMAVGIEGMVGMTLRDRDQEMPDRSVGGSASLTFEMYSLMRLFD